MDLFPDVSGVSPMEEWRVKHGVGLYRTQDGYRASNTRYSVHGSCAEEALLAWADKAGVKCWKAEELEKLNNKSTQ